MLKSLIINNINCLKKNMNNYIEIIQEFIWNKFISFYFCSTKQKKSLTLGSHFCSGVYNELSKVRL